MFRAIQALTSCLEDVEIDPRVLRAVAGLFVEDLSSLGDQVRVVGLNGIIQAREALYETVSVFYAGPIRPIPVVDALAYLAISRTENVANFFENLAL
jgi:hypothetical protein